MESSSPSENYFRIWFVFEVHERVEEEGRDIHHQVSKLNCTIEEPRQRQKQR
jgi:hypothetical protein